jgi:hypothetical protein
MASSDTSPSAAKGIMILKSLLRWFSCAHSKFPETYFQEACKSWGNLPISVPVSYLF